MGAVEGASYTLVIVGGELPACLSPHHPLARAWMAHAAAARRHACSTCEHLDCAGLAVAGAVLWAAANELLIQPKEYTCYNLALERIRWGPGRAGWNQLAELTKANETRWLAGR